MLLDKLNALKYEVVHDMPDYCKRFRHYETQIYEMAFTDRLDYFREDSWTSGDAYSAHKDMEVIYQLAGQEPHRRNKPLLKFGKKCPGGSSFASATTVSDSDEEDLDIIVPEQLSKMDLMATECWNCGKPGHFSRDCKFLWKDKKVNFVEGNATGTKKYGNNDNKPTLDQTVEESSSENDDDRSDYGALNPPVLRMRKYWMF